jgi:predicted solute-binding protein
MLAKADAALLIGDPALFADAAAHGADKIDLGESWTSMTARPFVWAFWAGPSTAASAAVVPLLQETAERGMAHTDDIARAYCADTPARWPLAERYLRDHLRFRLDERALDGLQIYYREAHRLGLAPQPPASLRFLDAPR